MPITTPACVPEPASADDAAFERLWRMDRRVAPNGTTPAAACDESFFQRVRALGDHPVVRDLNAHIDAVVLPALFAHPGAMNHLPAILAAAEMDGGVLDI